MIFGSLAFPSLLAGMFKWGNKPNETDQFAFGNWESKVTSISKPSSDRACEGNCKPLATRRCSELGSQEISYTENKAASIHKCKRPPSPPPQSVTFEGLEGFNAELMGLHTTTSSKLSGKLGKGQDSSSGGSIGVEASKGSPQHLKGIPIDFSDAEEGKPLNSTCILFKNACQKPKNFSSLKTHGAKLTSK